MDKNLEFLYGESMKLLLERDAKHKQFFTQAEYEKNIGLISILSKAKSDVYKKIKDLEKDK